MKRLIIAGFGPAGRAVHDNLAGASVEVTIIETNPQTANRQAQLGRRVVRGDATSAVTLRTAGIEGADAFVVTLPDAAAAVRACSIARELSPRTRILVRTAHQSDALCALHHGASDVVVAELETARSMAHRIARALTPDPRALREGAD